MKNILILLFISILSQTITYAQPGTIDLTFNPTDIGLGNGDGANSNIYSTSIQSDGKIIIGGNFTSFNGIARNKIARLNADGTLDNTFNPGTGANNSDFTSIVYTTSIQSDGKIIIGGNFTTFNGVSRKGIARLNTDGSLDSTFNPGTGAINGNNSGTIRTTCIQSDGRIIIGGNFTSYNGTTRNRIARVSTDGTIDLFFNPGTGASGIVYAISIQNDGKIIIGGSFTGFNGLSRSRIARINTNGTLDAAFNIGTGAYGDVLATSIQNDGKIIIGGDFIDYNNIPRNRIARLNTDGTLDATFNPGTGADSSIWATSIQSDGKIIIGGSFDSYNGTARSQIARLNSDGMLDTSFISVLGTGTGNIGILTTSIQSDGKIIVGGKFTINNGTTISYISRINSTGFLDNTFNPVNGGNGLILSTSLQNDGKIIIGGGFTTFNNSASRGIARLNNDGTLDNSFYPGLGANDNVWSTSIQSDGKIIIGGDFSTFNGISRKNISRLNTSGTIDNSFNPGTGADSYILTTSIQSDGKIIIGGNFTSYNGTTINRIARLNLDGTLDFSFNPGTGVSALVYTTSIQSDGKIIIGGQFSSFNGTTRSKIARLNTDGTLDTTFNPATGTNNTILTTSIQSDGKIIIGGSFTSYNGTAINCIARLNTNGTLDITFNPGTGINTNGSVWNTSIQSDGKIIIGGNFTSFNGIARNNIARLNTDGTLDNTFNPGSGSNNVVYTTSIQNDGKIIIGGDFTSYNGTGKNRLARINGDNQLSASLFENDAMVIYPNPSKGLFNLTIDETEYKYFSVYSILGQKIILIDLTKKETIIDISGQPKGVYVYYLHGNNGKVKSGKLVVE
jgi:uncharacterized delta-60 repeat protein